MERSEETNIVIYKHPTNQTTQKTKRDSQPNGTAAVILKNTLFVGLRRTLKFVRTHIHPTPQILPPHPASPFYQSLKANRFHSLWILSTALCTIQVWEKMI
jgi:hypothetical protein